MKGCLLFCYPVPVTPSVHLLSLWVVTLDFSSGTIVELNRQAGSQVDVFVNGKAIAKGNVVVVDDNYGVRITEVMNSELKKLF